MRTSNRESIVAGALAIIDGDGVDGLTFQALAERTGLSRGGIVYHFATREALLARIAEDLMARWRAEALDALDGPLEESTRTERLVALVTSCLDGVLLPGELAFLASGRPEAADLNRAWEEFRGEWIGDPLTLTPEQRVGLLAVEGWWTERAVDPEGAPAMDAAARALVLSLVSSDPSGPSDPSRS